MFARGTVLHSTALSSLPAMRYFQTLLTASFEIFLCVPHLSISCLSLHRKVLSGSLLEKPGHERLAVHVHAGPALVVVLGELLDPVGGEPGALPLLQHVVGRVGPPVGSHLLKAGPGVGLPLEDPHQQPCALHCALLVQPLELELDTEDVVLGLLRGLTLEGKLTRHKDIEQDTKGPDIRLREGLRLLQDLGSSVVKVVSALDLGS